MTNTIVRKMKEIFALQISRLTIKLWQFKKSSVSGIRIKKETKWSK